MLRKGSFLIAWATKVYKELSSGREIRTTWCITDCWLCRGLSTPSNQCPIISLHTVRPVMWLLPLCLLI